MTMEDQYSSIRVDFYNEYKMPKQTEFKDAIGKKMTNLVKPWNEALVHPPETLLEAYTTEGCPENCGPDWVADHIEASLSCSPQPLAD